MKRRTTGTGIGSVIGAVALICSVIALGAPPASAATFTVTRFDDPSPGPCLAGDCSLREAIDAANANPATVDTIELAAGTYVLTISGIGEDANQTGDLDIDGFLTISGAGSSVTVLDVAGLGDRAFDIRGSGNVVLEDFAIINANLTAASSAGGGAIRQRIADLRLDGMRLENNKETVNVDGIQLGGGAISSSAPLTVVDSVFVGNSASELAFGSPARGGDGGAIKAFSTLEVLRSSFVGNTAGDGAPGSSRNGGDGGAIYSLGETTIDYSLFTTNSAGDAGGVAGSVSGTGGAISSAAQLEISNSTFVDNQSGASAAALTSGTDSGAGGAIDSRSQLTVTSSTFIGNSTADGGDAAGASAGGDAGAGGAIWFESSDYLTIRDSTFESNSTGDGGVGHPAGVGGDGGAIWLEGRAGIESSTFEENSAGDGGQGVYFFDISGAVPGEGGSGGNGGAISGIGASSGIPPNIESYMYTSTFSGNTAGAGGKGANGSSTGGMTAGGDGGPGGNGGALHTSVWVLSELTLANNTAGNPGPGGSAGFFGTPGSPGPAGKGGGLATEVAIMQATVIATNSAAAGGVDCFAEPSSPLFSQNHNLIGVDSDCSIAPIYSGTPNDQIGTLASPIDPLLAPLGFNGGPTLTMMPLPGSPLIDSASVGSCSGDQRGFPRPVGPKCDIGAVEVTDLAMTLLPTPCPIYDSTTASGAGLSGAFTANETRTVQVTGPMPSGQGVGTAQCVPPQATAVVYTISAIGPQAIGNLRLSATSVVPNGGVVNYAQNGLNNANTVTVPLGLAGEADITANTGATGVRLVAIGYYSLTGTLSYNPLTPCAVADSRTTIPDPASGIYAGPFTSGAAYPDLDVVGVVPNAQGGNPAGTNCGVPATADAVVVNLVAIRPQGAIGFGGAGYLSAATGATDPFEPATPFADLSLNNAASTIIPLTVTGEISVDVDALGPSVSSHIRVVVLGYLDEVTGDAYQPVNPCAAFDTRSAQGATGGFVGKRDAGAATTYAVTGIVPATQGGAGGDCGVPAGATAVLINLVAIQADATGNLRAYATGTTPTGGVLNFAPLSPPMNNSNAIVVPISVLGQLDLFVNAPSNTGNPTVHARGIILGYYN